MPEKPLPANPNPPSPLNPNSSYNFSGNPQQDVTLADAQLVVKELALRGLPGATIFAMALSTSSSESMPNNPYVPQSQFDTYKVPEQALLILLIPGISGYREVYIIAWFLARGFSNNVIFGA